MNKNGFSRCADIYIGRLREEGRYSTAVSYTHLWEPVSLYKACWVESDDPAELEAFKKRKYQYMAKDREGRDVFLADSGYVLQMAQMAVSYTHL